MKNKIIEFKNYLQNNTLKIILLVIVLILYVAQFIFMNYIVNTKLDTINDSKNELSLNLESEVIENEEEQEEYIYIDIKGQVKKPNVYKLLKGSRVNDAIQASGGLSKDANTRFVNLSKVLNDGDVIVIYSNSEIKKAQKTETIYVETPCVCEEVKNDACYKEDNSSTNISNGLININTSSKEELMTLNGIGESKANAIIEYREKNGKFKNIQDITLVTGISQTIYDKIKNNITI